MATGDCIGQRGLQVSQREPWWEAEAAGKTLNLQEGFYQLLLSLRGGDASWLLVLLSISELGGEAGVSGTQILRSIPVGRARVSGVAAVRLILQVWANWIR